MADESECRARLSKICSARKGPFVPVNCAAIAESLIESELFGHEKGSFTGADRRRQGHVERANGGTLFLDEITEMRSDAQGKLLRVIEEKTVLPVGGTEEIPIDVRFLAASNRPPDRTIVQGRLREDLYYRLNGLLIQLPPLRERIDNLPLLIDYFIAQANRDHHRAIEGMDDKCRQALGNYRWPGNIRQLHNVIETAVLLAPSNQISVNELPEEIRTSANHEGYFTVFLVPRLMRLKGNSSAAPSHLRMEIKPELRKPFCWWAAHTEATQPVPAAVQKPKL